MNGTSRCPFCGALLDVTWARSHAPTCPAVPTPAPPLTADVLAAVLELRADVIALRTFIDPWSQQCQQ